MHRRRCLFFFALLPISGKAVAVGRVDFEQTERKRKMNMKKMMMALAAGSLAVAAQERSLFVTDMAITQRYLWNG